MKPILFNTEMVKAILDGRKTVTRRTIKRKYYNTHIEWKEDKYGKRLIEIQDDIEGETYGRREDGITWRKLRWYREIEPPYRVGEILYVRETWAKIPGASSKGGFVYKYRASEEGDYWNKVKGFKWNPSIHMPKEAARTFLKVTNVRAERLQEITEKGAQDEGANPATNNSGIAHRALFINIWNSTVSAKDADLYGWGANPWVWVVEFKRIEKTTNDEAKTYSDYTDMPHQFDNMTGSMNL